MVIRKDRLIRLKEVLTMVNISRSTLYRLIRSGAFPEPVRLGERVVAWWESEVRAWMASRPKARAGRGS